MSYGFKFFNNNNETVIDDTGTKPWYFGEAPVQFFFDITNIYTDLNKVDGDGNPYTTFPAGDAPGVTRWNVYSVSFSVPSAYDCFVCFGLPNSSRPIYYAFEKTYAFAGDNSVRILIFVPNTVVAAISDIPKAYIFVANPVPTANLSTGYGMHVFNGSQQCTYDSNKKHFQPTDLPVIFVTDPTNYVYSQPGVIPLNENLAVTFPTSAAVLLPHVEVIEVVVDNNNYTVNSVHYLAIHRRAGSILRTGVPRIYTRDSSTNYTQSGFFNRGSIGVQPIVVLNAAPLDQGYTPPEFPASYQLSISRTNIIEGLSGAPEIFPNSTAIVTLTTAGVANGTSVPYTITGISSSDINNQPLTGNFIVSGNRATVTINATADGLFEGTETATLTLNNGKAAIVFTISDAQSFALSASRSNPEEGQSILVYLTTQNVPNGTQVPYTITGIQQADLTVGSLTGNFTVATSGANGTAQFQLTFARDSISESEAALVTLNGRGVGINIPITDLSFGYNETLSITPGTIQNNQNTVIQVTGGIPGDSFQWIILPTGTNPVDSFNNRWNSQYESFASSQVLYLDEAGNFYNQVTGPDFGGVGNWTLWIFTTTNKNFRSANLTVTAVPTFSLTGSNGTKGPLTINEGQIGYFLVTTTNLPNGSVVYPKLVGPNTAVAADIINSAQNGLVVNNNTASFTIEMVADQTTESDPEFNPSGQEFFNLVLDFPNGTRRDTYGLVYINDTSLTPASYSVTRSAASVNEGSAVTFQFITNQSGAFYWTLTSGIVLADILYVEYWVSDGEGTYWQNQGQINSGIIYSGGQVRVTFSNDQTTEGAESPIFSVRSGSTSGFPVASQTVTINDTSLYPAAGTNSGGPYCVGVNKYQNKHNGTGGTYAELIEANSLDCGYVPPASYTVTRSAASVNEGQAITMTITGNASAPVGTMLYWNMSGTNFTVNDIEYIYYDYNDGEGWQFQPGIQTAGWFNFPYTRTMQIIIYPRNDLTTEGAETVNFFLRSDSLSGPQLATTTLTINDTSVFPAAGTNSGGEYCVGFDRYQNKHNGSGGTYAVLVQSNSPSCGFNVRNEVLTITSDAWENYIVPTSGYTTIFISGGEPDTGFTFAITTNTAAQPTTFPGVASLNEYGQFSNYIQGYTILSTTPGAIGDMRLWVRFNYNGNVRSARVNIVPDPGTNSGGQYCVGTTLTQNKHNGQGGVYAETVQNNSPTCGYVQQYDPFMNQGTYYNYNGDGFRNIWYIYGAKPNSKVNFRIVAGNYVGNNADITTDGDGFGSFDIGPGPYIVGTYTINATFPGHEANYPTNKRTLVFNWVVFDGYGSYGGD
jgi:hypothetical protein